MTKQRRILLWFKNKNGMEGDLGTNSMCLCGPVLFISLLWISTHTPAMQKPPKAWPRALTKLFFVPWLALSITSKHIHKCLVCFLNLLKKNHYRKADDFNEQNLSCGNKWQSGWFSSNHIPVAPASENLGCSSKCRHQATLQTRKSESLSVRPGDLNFCKLPRWCVHMLGFWISDHLEGYQKQNRTACLKERGGR